MTITQSMTIAEVQIVRKIVLGVTVLLGVVMFALTNSRLEASNSTHEMIEWIGIVAIVVCVLGRTWTSLYIAGRKIEQLVTDGPYSVMRNPLYFFSIIGAAGAGAQHGSIVAGLTFGVLAWAVFSVVARQEERLLADRYGAAFENYVATVPRFMPNPRLWRDVPALTIIPPKILRTFADAMMFLLAVPIAEGFEKLQDMGVLPILLRLP
ncbi:MAG: isoprenylcysteine carboxylmethyltransferase family protein [Xanthobacteraceae bacterium]|nr:isoprenylcysteine carboxylmethyltransferase family protein [Xanthobacteraceae bacterium]